MFFFRNFSTVSTPVTTLTSALAMAEDEKRKASVKSAKPDLLSFR
jgi:hypothetical protein